MAVVATMDTHAATVMDMDEASLVPRLGDPGDDIVTLSLLEGNPHAWI